MAYTCIYVVLLGWEKERSSQDSMAKEKVDRGNKGLLIQESRQFCHKKGVKKLKTITGGGGEKREGGVFCYVR